MGQGPAFLFDLDGTLVDSVYQHVLARLDPRLTAPGIDLSVWRDAPQGGDERRPVRERPPARDRSRGDRPNRREGPGVLHAEAYAEPCRPRSVPCRARASCSNI